MGMKYALVPMLMLFWMACASVEKAPELIIFNADVVTLDSAAPTAQAVAIADGVIVKVGTNDEIKALAGAATELMDAKGAFVMPGFIEGHGHFKPMGDQLINLNLMATKSWQEIAGKVAEAAKTTPKGHWIIGRGWHQEKWTTPAMPTIHGWPFHQEVSKVSPEHPVVLYHASGHALFANEAAMRAAGVTAETANPAGGQIVRGPDGKPIGIFEENAMNLIDHALGQWEQTLPTAQRDSAWLRAVALAGQEALSKGITTFCDAGSSLDDVRRFRELADAGKLDVRLWVMLLHPADTLRGKLSGYPLVGDFLTVRAVKSYCDGALGSYGAWLLAPYSDNPSTTGQITTPVAEIAKLADLCKEHELQLCVHAIGDRANREVLNIMEARGIGAGHRWRMEHAQHIDTADIPRFGKLGVIASMQGIHCTSDAPFVVKRLGEQRARTGAYPWKSLLNSGAVIANGTDAPVEDCNPLACYYALVTRRRADTGFEFYPEQRLTRIEALRSYTIANAFAAFEEGKKGTITVGKFADLTILDKNILTCPEQEILTTRVLKTIVGGKVKYSADGPTHAPPKRQNR